MTFKRPGLCFITAKQILLLPFCIIKVDPCLGCIYSTDFCWHSYVSPCAKGSDHLLCWQKSLV